MTSLHWQHRIGNQRDWVWRGWQTRYTFLRAASSHSDTPLILLHGFGASIGHWRNNLEELAQHHTVYALDLLGFGWSDKALVSYDGYSIWQDQLSDFIKQIVHGQPVVLVGNSLGGYNSLATAAKFPNLVRFASPSCFCGHLQILLMHSIEQSSYCLPQEVRRARR